MQQPSLEPPLVGQRYRGLELIGEGGTATAWLAQDVARGATPVVVKVFNADSTAAALEFATLSQLDHPNLVKAHDLGVTEEGRPFVVVSYVDGPDLRTWSHIDGGRSLVELSTVISSLCRALASIHSRGVVHCDLKPENVIVYGGFPDRLQLIDFGLAYRSSPPTSAEARRRSGTIPYMAPELLGGAAPTVRADLYSLGVILHELSTGRLPAMQSSSHSGGSQRERGVEDLPDRLEPLAGLMEALLSSRPENRPRNAMEAITLLEEATGIDLGLSPTQLSGSYFPSPRILGSGQLVLQSLTERLNSIRSAGPDGGHLVLLRGSAASGKSRVVRDAGRHARLLGFTVLEHQHRNSAGEGEPILCLRNELETSVEGLGIEMRGQGSPIGEIVDVLLEAASRGPLLISIEGLLACHTFTIDVCHYLLYRLGTLTEALPLALLVASGDDQVAASTRLGALGKTRRGEELHLEPFDEGDVAQLVVEVVPGHVPDETFIAQLQEACRGVPGVALDQLRSLYGEGLLPPRAGRWPSDAIKSHHSTEPLGDESKALTLVRSPRFPAGWRAALCALSLLESPSPWSLWQAALGSEVALADIDIDELERARCIDSTVKEGEPQYAVATAPLAEELMKFCDVTWRRSLHERVLLALDSSVSDETRHVDIDPERLARHHAGCGRTEDAAQLLVNAARQSRHDHDLAKAERLIMAALSLGSTGRGPTVLEHVEVLRASGQFNEALEALAELDRPSSQSLTPPSHVLIGTEVLIDLGRFDDALSHLERIEPDSDLHPSSFGARFATLKARTLERLGRVDEAAVICRETLERLDAEEEKSLETCGELHHIAGFCAYTKTSYEVAARELERALDCFQRADDTTVSVVRVKNAQAMVRSQLGDLSGAAAEYGECLAMARGLRDPKLEAICSMNQATVAQLQGEHETAIDGYRAAIDLAEALGLVRLQARARANLGSLLTTFGSVGPARRQLEPALQLARDHHFKDIEALAASTLANVALQQEDWALGEAALQEAAACCSDPLSSVEITLERARFARSTRRWPEATKLADDALALAKQQDLAITRAQTRLLRGIIEMERVAGDIEAAKRLLEKALDDASQLELSEVEWQAHYFLFKLHREARQDQAARHHGLQAQALLERNAATIPPGYREAYASVRDRREASSDLASALRLELNDAPGPQGERIRAYRQLLEIARELVSERAVEPLLARILDRSIELTGAERAFVILRRDDDLDVVATRHMDADQVRESTHMVSRSIAEEVIRAGRPILTVDAAEDERFDRSRSVQNLQLRSILCVPLRMKGEILGALYLDNHLRTDAFAEEDGELVGAFANQVSLAIHNAQLHEAADRQRLELEEKTRQIDAQREELAQLVEQRTLELEEASARLRQHTDELVRRYEKQNLIGASKPMREVFSLVDRVSDSDISVLIYGESGTGKELIARAIHTGSPRARKAFVALNCAAIPGTLLESELFGHVRGAFTGATRDKPGLFELAHDGTLFLDEIGDMDTGLQAKLLRVLQEGTFRRVGDERERLSNARVISASHHDVSALITEGRFREDLYYRLNVVQIDLPPLRGRREDIPILIEHFLRLHDHGTSAELRRDALEMLLDYSWPGNVRELENEIHRAVVLGGSEITADSLSAKVRERSGGPHRDRVDGSLREAVAALERQMIGEALAQTGGNVSRAARILGLDRVVLYRKIKRFEIKR